MSRRRKFGFSTAVADTRRQGRRPPRRYFLIVCEGEKTEPLYFDEIRNVLCNGEGDRVVVVGAADNTQHLVERARREVEARKECGLPPFYHVWVVFDKDDFPDDRFDNAIAAIAEENAKADPQKKIPYWHAAWSNEAFEVWYLAHFRDISGGPISRSGAIDMLNKHFREELGIPDGYRKNMKGVYGLLRTRLPIALARAERRGAEVMSYGVPPHAANPATMVHKLVLELLKYE